ncbi:recombination mediator RecR [Magnetospirillum sp. 64-120]|uniref:recombination mediator RecR n=1 Tax=Magnetospirillum sp. 64-120 TaxID=1895778 RepID=UPI00092B9F79|nr:recombination mediator RecR [Magnetospirillum sp. 64-120]OJX72657.1 MAG: recombination protein RecR [Magnetospirillum sp. 64-120]
MVGPEIERLMQLLSRLPGLGPRSARRVALHLVEKRETLLLPLTQALAAVGETVKTCSVCGNFDSRDPCSICSDDKRDPTILCVVEGVGSLWAMERTGMFRGRYHVLGGLLSALDGIGPDDLGLPALRGRLTDGAVREVVLATPATVDGQTTAHYIAEYLAGSNVAVTALAHGVPVGGELDYLDDGTIGAALRARRSF